MKKPIIDIDSVCQEVGLDISFVAKQLFPTNQYPALALRRVMVGRGELNASQIQRLASIANLDPGDLFFPAPWKMRTRRGEVYLITSKYQVRISTDTGEAELMENGTLRCTTVLVLGAMTLSDLLGEIEKIISKL